MLCVTGNGLKTTDALSDRLDLGPLVQPRIDEFEALYADRAVAV